jgi:hypothetical protein
MYVIDELRCLVSEINSDLVIILDGKFKDRYHLTDNKGRGWFSFDNSLLISLKRLSIYSVAEYLVNKWITDKNMRLYKKQIDDSNLQKFYEENYFNVSG